MVLGEKRVKLRVTDIPSQTSCQFLLEMLSFGGKKNVFKEFVLNEEMETETCEKSKIGFLLNVMLPRM